MRENILDLFVCLFVCNCVRSVRKTFSPEPPHHPPGRGVCGQLCGFGLVINKLQSYLSLLLNGVCIGIVCNNSSGERQGVPLTVSSHIVGFSTRWLIHFGSKKELLDKKG